MNEGRRQLLGLGCGAALPALAQSPRTLVLVNAVLPPYVMESGEPRGQGMDVDLAREALRVAGGYSVELQLMPWRRALQMLEQGEADFTTSVHISPDRERFLAFSQPYGKTVRHHVYTRRGEGLALERLTQLNEHIVGLVAGHVFPEALQAVLRPRVERAKDLATLLRMLVARRVDVVVVNDLPAAWLVRQLGLGEVLERQPLVYDSGRRTQMGFSKRRPDHLQALEAMNRGLRQLARGTIQQRLEAHYLAP